jgi:hypothetical protein
MCMYVYVHVHLHKIDVGLMCQTYTMLWAAAADWLQSGHG